MARDHTRLPASERAYEARLRATGLDRKPTVLLYGHANIRHAVNDFAFGGRFKDGEKQHNGTQLRSRDNKSRKPRAQEQTALMVQNMAFRYAQRLRRAGTLAPYPADGVAMRAYIDGHLDGFRARVSVRGLVTHYRECFVQGFYQGLVAPLEPLPPEEMVEARPSVPASVPRRSTRVPCDRCGTRSGRIDRTTSGKWLCADERACLERAGLPIIERVTVTGGSTSKWDTSNVTAAPEKKPRKPRPYKVTGKETYAQMRDLVRLGRATTADMDKWVSLQGA